MSLRFSLVLALFFFLPAAFSYPGRAYYWLTRMRVGEIVSVFHFIFIPAIILSILLLVVRTQREENFSNITKSELGIFIALLLWFIAATLSFLFNFGVEDVQVTYVSGYLSPLLVYLALKNLSLTKPQRNRIFLALSFGALFPLISGAIAYYNQWGIPNASTLMLSFYHLPTMVEYQQATFGNVGNTATFFILIGSPFLTLALDQNRNPLLRLWFASCLFLIGFHLLIIQSRTSFLVLLVSGIIILYFKKLRKSLLIALSGLGIILPVIIVRLSDLFDFFSQRFLLAVNLDRQADNSVDERLLSIKEGWNIFLDNWEVGVGPGASHYYNPVSTAHQFIVQQGSELGILGIVASILLALAVFYRLIKILLTGSSDTLNSERFTLIIGPVSYLLYGLLSNMVLNIGIVNSWIVLMAAFLALVDFKPKLSSQKGVSS